MTVDRKIEHRQPVRIHLLWKGPHTYSDVLQMDDDTDFGLYQVYGPHPVAGTDSLLYIGQASYQTFSERFRNPDRQWWNPIPDDARWGDNTALRRYFTGRVHLTHEQDWGAIDDELWATYIDKAEKLLIVAHAPHLNAQGVANLNNLGAYDDCHVLNWGTRASLLPEVSGVRHAQSEFDRICDDPLGSTENRAG